jgi:pseudaminic acid synthase
MSFNQHFTIDGKQIGPGCPTYIIAEMSANHGHDLGRAKEMVHAAKEVGADAIKLQTYTADTLTLDCEAPHFYITEGPWKGQYLHDLYKDAYTPWEWHAELFELAKSIDLTCFSSPFDPTSVELLESLGAPAYKIASPEIIELALIRQVAETGKPVIISTGGATRQEITEAVNAAAEAGAKDLCLLKCTSSYPAPPDSMNLNTIPDLQAEYNCPVGLSDHSMGFAVPVASISLGVCVIEKHFVLNREDETADSFFSMTPAEFSTMTEAVRIAEQALGEVSYPTESNPTRRCLYAIADIKTGETLTADNVRSMRPGGGLEPKQLDKLLGRQASADIARGTQLQWDLITDENQ